MIYRFANPEIFILVLLIPVILFAPRFKNWPLARLRFSYGDQILRIRGATSNFPLLIPRVLRVCVILALIVAAARPQSGHQKDVIYSEGLDIIIALDISGSMAALDFKPSNRLDVAKNVVADFIDQRKHDRIGLVLFGSESFTLCPLTLDHDLLKAFLDYAEIGMVQRDTAIGKALGTAINRLRLEDVEKNRESLSDDQMENSDSQIVILCTDGVNTVKGNIDPITASKAAEAMGIKIYTVGIGSNGMAPFPGGMFRGQTIMRPVELDEELLRQIAQTTGGQYFPARNSTALKRIFEIIDTLEKREIKSYKYTRYTELFQYPLIIALILFFAEFILKTSIFRRYPR